MLLLANVTMMQSEEDRSYFLDVLKASSLFILSHYTVYQTPFTPARNIKGKEQEYAPKESVGYLTDTMFR